MTTREERLAENEVVFREVNEQIAEIGVRFELETVSALCECVSASCTERFELSRASYAQVRSSSVRFVVVPGHEKLDVETVVDELEGYFVVEKIGVGARVAEQRDEGSR